MSDLNKSRRRSSARNRALQRILASKAARVADASVVTGGWRELSGIYTDLADRLSLRDDLVVTIAPHAAGFTDAKRTQAIPGRFWEDACRIELDGALLGDGDLDPADLDTSDPETFKRMAALHGVFCHELGHADFSNWDYPDELEGGAPVAAVMALLEEIRMEARVVATRPDTAPWLRAAARHILCDTTDGETLPDNAWGAAQAATLTLGRVIAGSLQPEDAAPVAAAVRGILDEETLEALVDLWSSVVDIDDDDATSLAAAAGVFCKLVKVDPDHGDRGAGDGGSGALSEALSEAMGAAADAAADDLHESPEADQELPDGFGNDGSGPDTPPGDEEVKSDFQPDRDKLKDRADEVFPRGGGGHAAGPASGGSIIHSERRPTTEERVIRRQLVDELRRARWRDRDVARVPSELPPGRLRVRAAMTADAHRAAGRHPDAAPWKRKRRQHVDQPKIRVGLLLDVSGSMHHAEKVLSSSAWVLANAIHDVGGRCAIAGFGDAVDAIAAPGQPPTQVYEFSAHGGTEHIADALDVASGALELYTPGQPRLVVILSDGHWVLRGQDAGAITRMAALRRDGCRILQVGIHRPPLDHGADACVTLGRVEDFVPVVGRAALDLLKRAHVAS